MESKGISPLIAAVLMIAFTMAVASLFSGWIQGLQSSTQEDVSNTKKKALSCTKYDITINDASANSTLIKQTRGPDGIGNISVTWEYSGSTSPQKNYTSISSPRGFAKATAGVQADSASVERITASSLNCSDVRTTWTN